MPEAFEFGCVRSRCSEDALQTQMVLANRVEVASRKMRVSSGLELFDARNAFNSPFHAKLKPLSIGFACS